MRGLFDSRDYFFKFNHFQKYISFFPIFFAELQKSILEEGKNNTSRPKKNPKQRREERKEDLKK